MEGFAHVLKHRLYVLILIKIRNHLSNY